MIWWFTEPANKVFSLQRYECRPDPILPRFTPLIKNALQTLAKK